MLRPPRLRCCSARGLHSSIRHVLSSVTSVECDAAARTGRSISLSDSSALILPTCRIRLQLLARAFSSSSGGTSNRGNNGRNSRGSFKLDAVSFKVSPDEALAEFNKWAIEDQGLRYLLNWKNVGVSAAFAPVWSFDINIRFVTRTATGQKRYDLKPEPFAVYRNTDTVYIPGLSAYSGYTYRRSLINPVHNTTLVFMGDKTVPFGSWMLRDMKTRSGMTLPIYPDPWTATKSRAFAVIVEELEALAEEDIGECEVETEMVSARRVYMPTYVIDYKILGGEYRAFLSGCDAGSGVSGVSHRAMPFSTSDAMDASNSFLSHVGQVARRIGPGPLAFFLNFFINIAARTVTRIPIISALGAGFVFFRKIAKPWYDNRIAGAEWERQREHEAYMEDYDDPVDDFSDRGGARSYFQKHRTAILRYLSGEHAHEEGTYNWYQQWEEWAKQQYEKQQQAAEEAQRAYERATGYQQQQQQQQWQRERARTTGGARQQRKATKKKEYVWDFNPDDPYAVLGIKRGATKTEVSQAFRREMLKYHPDTQGDASEAEKERSLERSKLITEAYRKIKAQMK
mmetsp:Transcript_37124/g.81396  ORF Transcript_37124/g.81396 Transcript_37124/m.81396 type:complete len:569 (-) Transcript_37124:98-1804(-)